VSAIDDAAPVLSVQPSASFRTSTRASPTAAARTSTAAAANPAAGVNHARHDGTFGRSTFAPCAARGSFLACAASGSFTIRNAKSGSGGDHVSRSARTARIAVSSSRQSAHARRCCSNTARAGPERSS
jgi:hypothetical protein